MPFTPFHFGPGAALHSVAPRHVSFLAFCGANVLVDFEPLYYILTNQYPLHRFFHSYVGVSLVVVVVTTGFLIACRVGKVVRLPDPFEWQQLRFRSVLIGSALGGYSHVALDSVMHSDIQPLAPFSEANALYLKLGISCLHWWCLVAGAVGLVVLGFRRGFSAL